MIDTSPTPRRSDGLTWPVRIYLAFMACAVVYIAYRLLVQAVAGPAVELIPLETDRRTVSPGQLVSIPYRFRATQVPVRAEITETWWFASAGKTLIADNTIEFRNLIRAVDRNIEDETVTIPRTYRDSNTGEQRPIPCGEAEYRYLAVTPVEGGNRSAVMTFLFDIQGGGCAP